MATVAFRRQRSLPSEIEKQLPHNIDAERSLLGAVLMDNSRLDVVAETIQPDDFFHAHHRTIYVAMLKLAEDEQAIDLLTLNDFLHTQSKLDAAGGAAYLAQLTDGVPHVSNVKFYAEIVHQKSVLRGLIYATNAIQQLALSGDENAETVIAAANKSLSEVTQTLNGDAGKNPAVVIGFSSVLKRECAPVEYAIQPLLSSRGTGEIYAWRGTGKSFIGTQMAVDISLGKEMMFGGHKNGGGHWPITRAYRVLYVYGEMDDSTIKERSITIARMNNGQLPTDEQLGTMCKDYQKDWRPKISTYRDRKFIEDRIFGYGYEGVILDNISTLWPAAQEKQSDRSAELAEWFTDLNQRGIWVIFQHHAGKSGEQRGDSEKEDMLDFVIKLRRPANYKVQEGLRIEVHIEKNRFKPERNQWLMPFEIHLTKDANGDPAWLTRPAHESQLRAAFEMFKNDMPVMFVGQEVGVSKATIYRWKKDFDENQNPEFHLTADGD